MKTKTKTKHHIAGVDEAGRGPLAGPVVAAAVILDPKRPIEGLADSKLLSANRRQALYDIIIDQALCYAIAKASVIEIDRINILQASLLAMQRALSQLDIKPHTALIDGIHSPQFDCKIETIIKGDQKIAAISAASILAKVYRDREMQRLDRQYPGYGLAQNKGYPTKSHVASLQRLGASKIHRKTYAPVRAVIATMMETD